jgi:hypothetical protein
MLLGRVVTLLQRLLQMLRPQHNEVYPSDHIGVKVKLQAVASSNSSNCYWAGW